MKALKDKMAEKTYNLRLILLVALVVFALIVAMSAIGTLTAKKRLGLENLDQVASGLSSEEASELERFIWEDLRVSQEFGEDKSGIVALLRPSSFIRYDDGEIRHYEMLVDVDEFRQTLAIRFALNKGGFMEAPVIECPQPKLMKYADMECKSGKTTTATVTVGSALPYYFTLETGELVTVTLKNDGVQEYLNVRVNSCGKTEIMARARTAVVAWLRGLGYEPNDYEIRIPEFCDGEAG